MRIETLGVAEPLRLQNSDVLKQWNWLMAASLESVGEIYDHMTYWSKYERQKVCCMNHHDNGQRQLHDLSVDNLEDIPPLTNL